MTDHHWSPPYEFCQRCGKPFSRSREPCDRQRTQALRQARALIQEHAQMTWKSGQIERSDGITNVLVEFDLRFPEAKER